MSSILIALVVVGVLMLLLALFAGRGAGETRAGGVTAALDLTLPELTRLLRDAFAARGFAVVSEVDEPGHADLLFRDASPLTGQTIYVRCLADGVVDSVEVQAALDRIRGDQLEKAIVATPGEFSQEARGLARGTNVELLDGAALGLMLGRGERRAPALRPPVQAS